jgi:hypothetical protein
MVKMESETRFGQNTLLEELVERSQLSWLQITIIVSAALVALLLGVAFLSGVLPGPFDTVFWFRGLLPPVIIGYLLLSQARLKRLRDNAVGALRPLVRIDDDCFDRMIRKASMFNRRQEWLAIAIGATAGWLLNLAWGYPSAWINLYIVISNGLMYGLIGWFIYSALSGTRLFSEFQKRPLDFSIFDIEALEPIGRWSQGISLTFIGGISISLLLSLPELSPSQLISIEAAVIYGSLITATLLVFFLNMVTTRNIILVVKNHELAMVKSYLTETSKGLNERKISSQSGNIKLPPEGLLRWLAYEKRVQEVPVWPYTSRIRRSLLLSLLLPALVFLLPHLVREVILQLILESLPLR